MDHQRQAGLARRRDMRAEALLLRFARAVVVVIVEPASPIATTLGWLRARDQSSARDVELLVRHDADGCRPSSTLGKALGDGEHLA